MSDLLESVEATLLAVRDVRPNEATRMMIDADVARIRAAAGKCERCAETAKDAIDGLRERIAFLEARRDELHAANNALLKRAREAEDFAKELNVSFAYLHRENTRLREIILSRRMGSAS